MQEFGDQVQVSAVSAGFAAASNLQSLRRDALLKNSVFNRKSWVRWGRPLLRVLMPWVLNPRFCRTGFGPSDRQTGRQARQWPLSRSPGRAKQARKRLPQPRRARLGLQCLSAWGHLQPPLFRWPYFRSSPFVQVPAEEPAIDPTQLSTRRLGQLLQLPQPDSVDGVQVGARFPSSITFLQRPQLTHQCISFRARNSRQDLQQAVDALLSKGAIERVSNVTSLRFYSRLFLVLKKTGDLHPVIDLSTLNRHMVVPHFKMETQGSVRSAIRSQEWTVSIDIHDAYPHVPMHKAIRKYLRFVVNKQVYQFTCLPFGLATSPREFTKLLRLVVALLRQRGVKLLVYLDNWLIHADTPEQAQLHAQMTISVLQFLSWIINYDKSDLTLSQDLQFIGMLFNTQQFTVVPLPKMRLKVQSVHQHWMTNPIITAIFADCWAWWCLWLSWYHGEDSVFIRSSDGPPQLGARGPGTGPTGLQFLSGSCQRWPGGHLQQSCKVFPSPPGKRKWLSSQMRPVRSGEPS